MHYFKYKGNILYAEDIPINVLVEQYGTPLYIYSAKTLRRHLKAYTDSLKALPHIICYAVKANSNAAILRLLGSMGAGADVVSGGELYRALRAGIPAGKIVYAGVGKRDDEIEYALRKRILMFNVESIEELENINHIAGKIKKTAPVALRINPDIDPETHPYISTGLKKNKFGIPIETALEFYKQAKQMKHIRVVGIHKHIGSQITKVNPFVDALERILILVEHLKQEGIHINYLDIGGGLGIRYNDEEPPHPKELAKQIIPLLKKHDLTLVVEPGRSIVGNAGILVTRVLYTKAGFDRKFIIVDAGMNDLMRPSLYNAFHQILPVKKKRGKKVFADVVGPICETGDFLAKGRELPDVRRNDFLAVMSAGAYGFSMSSNYNSRPRPAEVLVDGNMHYLIRERETYRDLVRGEKIPDTLKE
ncbi:MAG: diaminopimelate decarboxylase [Nitrospirae bacterium]|nr:diaminopimelate decarboxylase [Nitrospirota bacterium]